jgi:thioredoxin 1
MKRIVPVFLCLAAVLSVHADVVELDNGQKTEGSILGFSNQRFDVADKSGSISHFSLQRVKRIDFESSTATIVTRGRGMLHGQLLRLQDGFFILLTEKGEKQAVPAAQIIDLTVNGKGPGSSDNPVVPATATESTPGSPGDTLSPSPTRSKPATIPASSSRRQGEGSIKPEHGKITIVDFYADWCGPCRHISPILDKIAEGNSDIALQKINIDKRRDLAQEYNVTAIPRIIIYDKNGREVDTVVGANELRVRQAIKAASGT